MNMHTSTHSHKGSVSTRTDSNIGKEWADWAANTRDQPGDKESGQAPQCAMHNSLACCLLSSQWYRATITPCLTLHHCQLTTEWTAAPIVCFTPCVIKNKSMIVN